MSMLDRLHNMFRRRADPPPAAPRPPTPVLAPTPHIREPPPSLAVADAQLLRETWNDHLQHNPGMSPQKFIEILEWRHRFYAEERLEREAKLAKLNASVRPLP